MSNYRNADLEAIASQMKALANPNRLRIFLRLLSCCDDDPGRKPIESCACVGDVSAELGLAPSTVSHHIKEMRQAGLIELQRNGQRVECRVPSAVLDTLSAFFEGCRCGEVIETIPSRPPKGGGR